MIARDSDSWPDFEAVSVVFQRFGLLHGPAEAQGLALGLLVASVSRPQQVWLEEMCADLDPADPLVAECQAALDRLFADLFADTDHPQSLTLLLPQDIKVDSVRLTAVREWCQGFLYGFGLGGDASGARVSQAGRELLGDIAEFTRLDTTMVENNPDDQAALIEIEEYLREGVMLMRDEMSPGGDEL